MVNFFRSPNSFNPIPNNPMSNRSQRAKPKLFVVHVSPKPRFNGFHGPKNILFWIYFFNDRKLFYPPGFCLYVNIRNYTFSNKKKKRIAIKTCKNH